MLRTLVLSLVAALASAAATAAPAAASVGIVGAAVDRPWTYWLGVLMLASAALVLLVVLPLGYYLRVWRLKQRGR